MVDRPDLLDIKRRLEVIKHDLDEYRAPRPVNGDDVTIAYRKVQEAILFVSEAKERET